MLPLYVDTPYKNLQITRNTTEYVEVLGRSSPGEPCTLPRLLLLHYAKLCFSSSSYITKLSLYLRRQLAHHLAALEPTDSFRHKHESLLLEKLYDMGILGTAGAGGRGKLSEVENKVTVSSMCRRRLGVVMTRLKMADTVQAVCGYQVFPTHSWVQHWTSWCLGSTKG